MWLRMQGCGGPVLDVFVFPCAHFCVSTRRGLWWWWDGKWRRGVRDMDRGSDMWSSGGSSKDGLEDFSTGIFVELNSGLCDEIWVCENLLGSLL
jgi:hypothetical protein